MLRFWTTFLKRGVRRIIYVGSATTKRFMECFEFVSVHEKQNIERHSLIGSLGWFAMVSVFDVSFWSWSQTLSNLVIIN